MGGTRFGGVVMGGGAGGGKILGPWGEVKGATEPDGCSGSGGGGGLIEGSFIGKRGTG